VLAYPQLLLGPTKAALSSRPVVGIDTQAWHAITAHNDRLKDSATQGHDRSLILGQAKELAESVARVVITERGDVAPANMSSARATPTHPKP
jgi:hypothetical protein